jgi:hypothetical protein
MASAGVAVLPPCCCFRNFKGFKRFKFLQVIVFILKNRGNYYENRAKYYLFRVNYYQNRVNYYVFRVELLRFQGRPAPGPWAAGVVMTELLRFQGGLPRLCGLTITVNRKSNS